MPYNIENIPPAHKELLDSFQEKYNKDLYFLVYHYGMPFALKVIEKIDPIVNAKKETVEIVIPAKLQKNFSKKEKLRERYLRHLHNAGIEIKVWSEEGFDRSSGHHWPIQHCEMFVIGHEPKKQIHHA